MKKSREVELKEINEERDFLRQRVDELERILARVDQVAIMSKLPKPVEDFDEDLPAKVIALAAVGIIGSELRADLGISSDQWSTWRREHPSFGAAALRAKDLGRAFWQGRFRRALENKDWKFPYAQSQKFIEELMRDDPEKPELADASKRIILHVGRSDCIACRNAEQQKKAESK